MKKKPVIGIALGGGGALGLAHIGVLQVLVENNIPIDIVTGTSMGALVGGIFASGIDPYEMEKSALKVKTISLIDINFNLTGVFGGSSADRKIKSILQGDKKIEDLPTEFACVAVDLVEGKEVVLNKGSLVKALRASYSVPGIFTPLEQNNQILVDGGVLNNLPDDVAKKMGADIVIGVDVIGDYNMYTKPKTIVHALAFSFFVQQFALQNAKKKFRQVTIQPKLSDYRQHIFNKKSTEGCILEGRIACLKQIPKIKKLIEEFNKKNKSK